MPDYLMGEFNGGCTTADGRREEPLLAAILQEANGRRHPRRARNGDTTYQVDQEACPAMGARRCYADRPESARCGERSDNPGLFSGGGRSAKSADRKSVV